MPGVKRSRIAMCIDIAWRIALWCGFRLARVWWRIRRPRHEGALVAIYVGQALLLVKSSYRAEWGLPGGGMDSGETPEAAARRELHEEIGFESWSSSAPLLPAGTVCGIWDGRDDRVHFFELHLDRLPELRLDNREIVAVRLASPEELQHIALTAPVALYMTRRAHDTHAAI